MNISRTFWPHPPQHLYHACKELTPHPAFSYSSLQQYSTSNQLHTIQSRIILLDCIHIFKQKTNKCYHLFIYLFQKNINVFTKSRWCCYFQLQLLVLCKCLVPGILEKLQNSLWERCHNIHLKSYFFSYCSGRFLHNIDNNPHFPKAQIFHWKKNLLQISSVSCQTKASELCKYRMF